MYKYFFKGKTVENKQWKRGCLLVSEQQYFIVPAFGVSCIEEQENRVADKLITLHAFEIIPETLCRYTGINDRNGQWIFEHDIIRREMITGFISGEVVWLDIGKCGFYLKHGQTLYPIGNDEYRKRALGDEIIRNIFDDLPRQEAY